MRGVAATAPGPVAQKDPWLLRWLVKGTCVLLVLVVLYLTAVYSQIPFIAKWRTLYIETAMSTLSHHWLATYFIPKDVIDAVMADVDRQLQDNMVEESQLPPAPPPPKPETPPEDEGPADTPPEEVDDRGLGDLLTLFYELDPATLPDDIEDYRNLQISDIENLGIKTTAGDTVWAIDMPNQVLIVTVTGQGYAGKLAIAKDSSQVILASRLNEYRGRTVTEYCEENNAILGINAGGFVDPEGVGRGDLAVGLVLVDGVIKHSREGGYYQVAGFDYDSNFRVGSKLDLTELRYGVEFYPIIVLNGQTATDGSYGMGIQPRTAIGQTADKATLMLIIDGRQIGHSLGTTISECANIMLRYGCFNAMNMDGGSSSSMTYDGRMITKTSSPTATGRYLPCAWLVLRSENGNE